jgi:hypothetical protein
MAVALWGGDVHVLAGAGYPARSVHGVGVDPAALRSAITQQHFPKLWNASLPSFSAIDWGRWRL